MYKDLLERLNSLCCFEESGDSGSGQSSADPEPSNDNSTGSGEPEKTFTQDQVNSMVANERRKSVLSAYKELGFENAEDAQDFVKKYKEQEEKVKDDLTKSQEAQQQAEKERDAEKQKTAFLEHKFKAIEEGCDPKSAEDVVVLVQSKMSDDTDFTEAIKLVKEQYPAMFSQSQSNSTGTGGTPPRKSTGGNGLSGIGKRLAEQRKANAPEKNVYFTN